MTATDWHAGSSGPSIMISPGQRRLQHVDPGSFPAGAPQKYETANCCRCAPTPSSSILSMTCREALMRSSASVDVSSRPLNGKGSFWPAPCLLDRPVLVLDEATSQFDDPSARSIIRRTARLAIPGHGDRARPPGQYVFLFAAHPGPRRRSHHSRTADTPSCCAPVPSTTACSRPIPSSSPLQSARPAAVNGEVDPGKVRSGGAAQEGDHARDLFTGGGA